MPLSAIEFAQIENSQFAFGVSPKAVAETLRKIGDMVESGELCVQSARVTGLAITNDYSKTSIRLVLMEKYEGSGRTKTDVGEENAAESFPITPVTTGKPIDSPNS
jgi:hypothetical protein